MKRPILSRYVLSSSVAAAMVAGCGGSQPLIGAPGAMAQMIRSRNVRRSWQSRTLPEAQKTVAAGMIDTLRCVVGEKRILPGIVRQPLEKGGNMRNRGL